MRFMLIRRADADTEAGVMPSEELLAAMGSYNEELMKAGLIEIADIIVINKADLLGADVLAAEIQDELSYSPRRADQTVVLTQAHNNIGIEELFREIERRGKLPGPRAQA